MPAAILRHAVAADADAIIRRFRWPMPFAACCFLRRHRFCQFSAYAYFHIDTSPAVGRAEPAAAFLAADAAAPRRH